MSTSVHINLLLLGSCNMLLGMDWLYIHMTKVDFYDKAIESLETKNIYHGFHIF